MAGEEPTGQWEPPQQGIGQRERDWYRSCWWSHAAFCGCGDPSFHLAILSHHRFGPRGAPGGPPGPPPGPPELEEGGPPNLAPPQPPLPRFLPLPGLPPAPDQPPPRPGDGEHRGGADGAGEGEGGEWAPEDIEQLLEEAAAEDAR